MAYIGNPPLDVRSFGTVKFEFTATAGQTAFTGSDDNGKTLGFTEGQIEVYVNGVLMDSDDFTTSGGNTVTLGSAAAADDIITVNTLKSNAPITDYVQTTGGTFTGGINVSSGNVGIGTSNPLTKLHVKSEGAGNSYGSVYLEVDTATNYPAMVIQTATGGNYTETHGLYIKNTAAGYGLRIDDASGDTSPFVVDTEGRVGIGTDSPSNKTAIVVDNSGTTQSSFDGLVVSNSNSTTNNGSAISFAYGGNGNSFSKIGVINTDRSGGAEDQSIFFGTLNNGSYGERMRIDSSGNVGIGTTPSGYLTSGYVLRLNGGGQTYLAFNNSSYTTQAVGGFVIGNDNGAARITQRENDPIIVATNNTERMRIDSSGRVTKPNQPSFYAYPSSNTVHTVNQWNTVAFNATGWNVGGHFNTSNYRFTAPVSGKYQMTWTFQLENNNAPTWIYAYPVVNGNRNADRSRGVSFSDFMTSQYYHTENGTWILNLSANDYVTMDIYTSGATKEFKAESSWSGYLIG